MGHLPNEVTLIQNQHTFEQLWSLVTYATWFANLGAIVENNCMKGLPVFHNLCVFSGPNFMNISISLLHLAKIKHPDWLKIVFWLVTSNQSALFQHSVAILRSYLFCHRVQDADSNPWPNLCATDLRKGGKVLRLTLSHNCCIIWLLSKAVLDLGLIQLPFCPSTTDFKSFSGVCSISISSGSLRTTK